MSQFGIPQSGGMVNFNPPVHNPLASVGGLLDNPMLKMALAMYMPQMLGQNNFMPTLTPSQHLFDQYEAFKYQNARMAGAKGPRGMDQQVLAGRLLGVGAAVSGGPMTAMNAVQAGNIAGMLNNPLVGGLISSALGPETMEDLFYGTRGSAEMMYNSVASTGFHRRDPATGGRRMTGESMSGMASEMYSQLYGPNADVGAMNGISAGRAGTLYRDLAQRGLLPQSLGNLSASDRVKAVAENLPTDSETMTRLAMDYGHRDMLQSDQKLVDGKTYAELTPEQQRAQVEQRLGGDGGYRDRIDRDFQDIRAYNDGVAGRKSIGEIEQLEGFSGAARSIDASKVSNKLKEYSGAIAAVREIFGANGSPNAPMNQLINGLEALTQGSMSSMSPAKMETFVRKMQMSSRDSGIGLQAMLGISSQLGAFGDTLGLDRSFAAQNTLQAMDTVTSMRDAGNFNRGFGSMSQEQAAMSAGYLAQAGDASAVGNTLGAAARIVAENPDAHIGPDGKPKTELGAMVEAYNKGETEYVDPTTGKKVDLAKRVGEGGTGAVRDIMKGSGVHSAVADSIVGDVQGNQEFINAGMAARLGQRSGVEAELGMQVSSQLRALNENAGEAYSTEFGKQMSGTLIDDMRGIPAAERITVLKDRAMEVMRNLEREADPSATDAEIDARAQKKFSDSFGTSDDDVRQNMQGMLAMSNQVLAAKGAPAGLTANNIRDMMSTNVLENRDRLDAEHTRRAELMGDFGGAQSNVVQRFSDVMGALGSGDQISAGAAMQAVMGIIPKDRLTAAMTPGVQAAFSMAAEAYREGVITTPEEINQLRRQAEDSDPQKAAAARQKLQEYAGPGSDKIQDLDKLAQTANDRSANKKTAGGEEDIARAGRIVRGLEAGGTAGISMVATGVSEQLLGDGASNDAVVALAEALKSGDQEKIDALLPQLSNAEQRDQRTGRVKDIVGALAEMQKTGRGIGQNDAHAIAEARQNTMKELVTDDTRATLSTTADGRKMVAMAEAEADGTYTYEKSPGEKVTGNVYKELNGIDTAANDSFTQFLDHATNSLSGEQREEARKKIAGIKEAAEQGGGLGDIGKLLGGAGGLGDIFKGIIAAFEKALGGGISSATITIDSLNELNVQNASGTPGRSAQDVGGAGTEAARMAQQKEKQLDTAASDFKAAQAELGAIAQQAGVSLEDVKKDSSKLPEHLRAKADAAREREAASVKQINDLSREPAPTTSKPDYAALGATEEQRAYIEQVVADPDKFAERMRADPAAREAMLNLPDDAAIALFDQFDPEAQKKGLEGLATAKDSGFLGRRLGVTQQQQANAARLHKALSKHISEKQAQPPATDAATTPSQPRDTDVDIDEAARIVAQRDQEKEAAARRNREQEKRYTADELAALHPEGVKDVFGVKQKWQPATAAHLPTGNYTREQNGNYVDQATGAQYDRYGNPAGGTYSADGTEWRASDEILAAFDLPQSAQNKQDEARQEQADQRRDAVKDAKHTEQKQEKTEQRQNDKKREVATIVPPVDEKRDQQQRQEFMSQAKQAVMAESQRNIQYVANNTGGGSDEKEITGTLQLKGLTEVFMAASPKQMEQTNDGGPYVDTGNATKAYVGGAV